MSFTSVYDANGINIDDYFLSREVIIREFFDYHKLFSLNGALNNVNANVRLGPLTDACDRVGIESKQFIAGVYVLQENLDEKQRGKSQSLREALEKLEKILS